MRDIGHHPGVRRLAAHLSQGAQQHVHFRPNVRLDPSQIIDRRGQITPGMAQYIAVQHTPWFHQDLNIPEARWHMIQMLARGIQNTQRSGRG